MKSIIKTLKTKILLLSSLSKWQLKAILSLSAFLIVVIVVLITQMMVNDLIRREQKLIKFYSEMYRNFGDLHNVEDFWFLSVNVGPAISFPVILTKENDEPNYPFEQYILNIALDTTLSMQKQREFLQKYIEEMRKTYQPIIIKVPLGSDYYITKFYYTNSSLVNNLRYFPLISILIIFAFVFIGYMAFSNIRRNEESKVWVGMAKEAAHQLGTPLSSLLAWLEILKMKRESSESIDDTIYEMANDVDRLNKITTRFSKIGSNPEKKVENLSEVIEKVCNYFEKRLPHLGKRIEILKILDREIQAEINEDLFEWVVENLLKNAAEAIEEKRGFVTVTLESHLNKRIYLYVQDTGKGMNQQQKRQAFSPGFTTKKRGWGLGLSLVRRIVEDYHNGKIYIKETSIGKGTTFLVELPINNAK